jgi:hypothetical protein
MTLFDLYSLYITQNRMSLQPLPIQKELETSTVLKKLTHAHRVLAELKGSITSIPNQGEPSPTT